MKNGPAELKRVQGPTLARKKNEVIDLTVSNKHLINPSGFHKIDTSKRIVRREATQTTNDGEHGGLEHITYIAANKYFFQRFFRQHIFATVFIWSLLCFLELVAVLLYLVEIEFLITSSRNISWSEYDATSYSSIFWCRVVLCFFLSLQLLFVYSIDFYSLLLLILTIGYQLIVFAVAIAYKKSVSRFYIPLFLRCWSVRRYFMLVLDSIGLMKTHNRQVDLYRLAASPLTLFVCFVFTAACVFQIDQLFRGFPMTTGIAIYFIVVTFSTVGYGDVVPKSPEGQLLVIIFVFVLLTKLPTYIQAILSVLQIKRSYKSYRGRKDHFVVLGNVKAADVVSILDECQLLYPFKTVVFCNSKFSEDVLAVGKNPEYQLRTTFLTVDTLDLRTFKRLKIAQASAFFIFPLRLGHSSRVDDDVMLSSLIVKKHFPALPQCVWLRYGLHSSLLRKDYIVIEEHIKMCVLATALLLPGVIPFLVNVVRTAGVFGFEPGDLWSAKGLWDWENQYLYSRHQAIHSFPVPPLFVGKKFREALVELKKHGILLVGVKTLQTTGTLSLKLNHELHCLDLLVVIFHQTYHSLLLETNSLTSGFTFSPSRFDSTSAAAFDESHAHEAPFIYLDTDEVGESSTEGMNSMEKDVLDINVEEDVLDPQVLLECLGSLHFTHKKPCGVPLEKLVLPPNAVNILSALLHRHSSARDDPYCPRVERERLENIINNKLLQYAYAFYNGMDNKADVEEEIFIFVDQTSSILRTTSSSIYEDIVSQTIAQYQLYTMMRCVRGIQADSSAVLLTLRKFPKSFLSCWNRGFNSPLRCIRGQSSLSAHLNYALTTAADPARLRGVLLYCSQMGVRDFGDVPVGSVETNLRELIEAYERAQNSAWEAPERNIVVELECCSSCKQVYPFHMDKEWLKRGKSDFQDTLSFMVGRYFASNMLITLPFHSLRDPCVFEFFSLVLQLSSVAEMFDEATWANSERQNQAMFRSWSNKTASLDTFGAAFDFLLENEGLIAFGIFRLFPQKAGLTGAPRYFVTNPPRIAPLVIDDVIYCLTAEKET